jgi:hypothetical protein
MSRVVYAKSSCGRKRGNPCVIWRLNICRAQVEVLTLLLEMPEVIFTDQASAQVAELWRVNQAVNPA